MTLPRTSAANSSPTPSAGKLQPYDRISLNQIVSVAKKNGYKTNTFIKEIVLSKQFRYRQDL